VHSCDQHGLFGRHLATCTFPLYRNNRRPHEDDVFCPFPPSVDINHNDAFGQPLEYMSYFVDDHLIDLSDNQIDTTDFFRQYMAGFLISTRETAVSVCRSDDTNSVNDAMCQMIQATKTVQDKPAFTDTLLRQQYQNATNCTKRDTQNTPVLSYLNAVDCAFENYSPPFVNSFPNCLTIDFDVDNQTFTFVSDSGNTTDVSQATAANFSVDGAVRNKFDVPLISMSHFGRVHYTPTSTQITGATVYYNNQVYCHKSWKILSNCRWLYRQKL